MLRDIVHIDESLCDGCGECIPACHEGALAIIDGKARVVADRVCDGMGACLGTCPRNAIRIERRQADPFDPDAVKARRAAVAEPPHAPLQTARRVLDGFAPQVASPAGHGCPGARQIRLATVSDPSPRPSGPPANEASTKRSELRHWPVKLRLLSPNAPVLNGARLVVTADCVPVAVPDFHQTLLRDRAIVLACPKFEPMADTVDRLAALFRIGGVREVTVARMVVPCCSGLTAAVLEARRRAGSAVPVHEQIVSLEGTLEEPIAAE